MTTTEENIVIENRGNMSENEEDAHSEIELTEREADLICRESELKNQSKQIEAEKERLLALEKALEAQVDELTKREISIAETKQRLKTDESQLISRQIAIDVKEKGLETEFIEKHNAQQEELIRQKAEFELYLAEIKQKSHASLSAELEKVREGFNAEMTANREKRYAGLSAEIESERKSRLAALSAEIAAERQLIANENSSLNGRKAALDKQREELGQQAENLSKERSDIAFEKKRLYAREAKINEREESIITEVEEQIKDRIKTFEEKLAAKDTELADLRQQLGTALRNTEALESFKIAFGDDPDFLRRKFAEYEVTVKKLKNELANCPSADIKDEAEKLRAKVMTLTDEKQSAVEARDKLLKELADIPSFELQNRRLISNNADLQSQVQELEAKNETYRQRITRLSTQEGRTAEREERIRDIKTAIIKFDTEDGKYSEAGKEQPKDELNWLKGIADKCRQYGIVFPERILYAYHTALKISDWSPITVLAGVSGTGKSELPRLYSAFGGINFINIAVQPNWDSQESMLGFFNSIDNKFDAQPLLRFLVQCTEELKDYVSIALLDEMNLAHVEHYFADFLSKLEERRGMGAKKKDGTYSELPYIEVKLGAGISPYKLELVRNILWTGTMNQDETTKSLSDKVLDRGIVVTFPRPKTLEGRSKMTSIGRLREDRLLRIDTWRSWISTNTEKVFTDEQRKEINRFRTIVEHINDSLGAVGRAVGHRVWQSVEYYVANYPLVISAIKDSDGMLSSELAQAMHIAFEDQIVQKVMPKLRGIDTRGRSKEKCLDPIKALLETENFNLTEDFNNACEFGYGQFIWSSANYIGSGILETADLDDKDKQNDA